VTHRPRPTVADHADASAQTVRTRPCPRCGADTLTARTPDRVCAVDVRADPTPLDLTAEILARLDGRLTWCLTDGDHIPAHIRWRDRWHIAAGRCTHTVIADHHCRPSYVQETLG
jgi:ribosomal protein S27AE